MSKPRKVTYCFGIKFRPLTVVLVPSLKTLYEKLMKEEAKVDIVKRKLPMSGPAFLIEGLDIQQLQ